MLQQNQSCIPVGAAANMLDSAAAPQATHHLHSSAYTTVPLLAQIPDLSEDDPEILLEERMPSSQNRLISQSLASKLVLGGGILLVIAAILPFMFNKKPETKPAADEWSQWRPAAPAASAPVAPAWNGPTGQAASPSVPTSVVVSPLRTGPGANVKAPALTGNVPEQIVAKAAALITKNEPPLPNMPAKMPEPSQIADRFLNDRQPAAATQVGTNRPMAISDQRVYQADARADNRGDYRNDTRAADYRNDTRADYRNDNAADYRTDYRNGGPAPVNPVMPDLNRELSPQGPQSGVAQFQGTIVPPPTQERQ
jgi:hypothetical protein